MAAPILPGFHPDPTICRVGDDYYLAASSFEYFPGVPIFHSSDLLTWRQIGNVVDRPGQLQLPDGGAGGVGGIYAPTLRYHEGTFYLITTNVSTADLGHMIMTASDPGGSWSDPVFVPGAEGIDPDLTWDDEGRCHLTWSSYAPGLEGIAQARIDPSSGELLSAPRRLWTGSGLAWPESPHLYRVGDWWYLLIAEGGTERGHVVSVARSRTIDGDFVGASHNPIFSHRSLADPVQNTGHGDLVQTATGEWAMVYLGARPRGITPGFHVNGRETFLAGIDWVDGWPVIVEDRFDVPPTANDFVDRFETDRLDPRWITIGGDPSRWTRLRNSGLELVGDGTSRLLAVRARDLEWRVSAAVDISRGAGRLVVRLDDHHHADVAVGRGMAIASLTIAAGTIEIGRAAVDGGRLELWIRATSPIAEHNAAVGPDALEFGIAESGENRSLGSVDGRYLSTEVAGGFTGRVIGVRPDSGSVLLESFTYSRGIRSPRD